ncbi:hypothetical protein [Mesorhizobium sp. ISC15]|uniref:hypothetical protein n=1 Tax=Mesorhizobium sp. ISC15 TaxID=3076429 RepID=UPI00301D6C65
MQRRIFNDCGVLMDSCVCRALLFSLSFKAGESGGTCASLAVVASLMLKNGAPRGKPLSDFQKALLVQKSTSRLDTKMGEEN